MQLIASLNGKYFVESKYEPKYFVALKRREKIGKKTKKKKKNEKKWQREWEKKPSFEPRAQHLAVAFHWWRTKKSIGTQNKMPNRKFEAEM